MLEGYGPPLERQLFATHGYVVLGINYRGSTGRGAAFARSIFADWGHKEVEDLLAGVDYAVRKGIADPAHLGIGGWSYGGILTDYVIASDTRFGSAISGAGSGNQLTTYGIDEYIVEYNTELGPPWRNPALWTQVSYPFFHARHRRPVPPRVRGRGTGRNRDCRRIPGASLTIEARASNVIRYTN